MNENEKMYRELKPSLHRLEEVARYILSESVRHSGIKTHAVLSRVKSFDSFLAKINRKSISNPFDTIDDLVGLRVVCLFRADLKRLGKIVRNQFNVIREDNKLDSTTVNTFGYQSVHFVSRIKPSCNGPHYEGLHDINIEIQLRTVAMDTWATLSHYLDYKTESDVPQELRKDFFALSGLFYVADTHFELFYGARQNAGMSKRKYAKSKPRTDQELYIDSLSKYLVNRYPDRRHMDPIEIYNLLGELTNVGYTSLNQLSSVLEKYADEFVKYELSNPPEGGQFSDGGVVRMTLAIADPNYYQVKGYLKSTSTENVEQAHHKYVDEDYKTRQNTGVSKRKYAKSKTKTDQELNIDSLSTYLVHRYPDRKHLEPNEIINLLNELTKVGYTSLNQLSSIIEEYADEFAAYESSNPPEGGQFSDGGVVRITLDIAAKANRKQHTS